MRRPIRPTAEKLEIERAAVTDDFLQIYAVAHRTEDALGLELTRSAGHFMLQVILSEKAIARAVTANPEFVAPDAGIVLAKYDMDHDRLTTFPMTLASDSRYFLKPKYRKIRSITFEGHGNIFGGDGNVSLEFEELPLGCVRQPYAGFGLNHEYRFIVHALERVEGVTDLTLCEDFETTQGEATLRLPYDTFDRWRRAIRRSHNTAVSFGNQSKQAYLRGQVERELGIAGNRSEPQDLDALATSLASSLGQTGRRRSLGAAAAALKTVKASARELAEADPVDLLDLSREIELITLEDLIARLSLRIDENHAEAFWQKFFLANPFVLRLAFGLPVILFRDQVAVGGTKFDGSGGKIADFVMKAGLYGNLAIIEIKTPQTDLVEARAYRDEVHAPTRHLSGAVTQVADQRYKLQMDIKQKKVDSRQFDVFTYGITCVVIAGRDPGDEAKRKSFEVFRSSLKDVTVITFDELLVKLQSLHQFLTGGGGPADD
ncbi:DUF4263 domain-containing protein [Sphingomonadaceae bacterium G21617-S1]|jgi:hypothetical protein|uniref:Shedu immune nuclease family protein n=1 Tax=Sphingomonadales TaxID=204457 RepID=UPI0016282421|nr:Shedu immune nuclease family protein [Sphingomonas sp. NBWT7]MCZ4343949.1 DUF4263 domain-containing protein [Sphingomonadaceae bacterium G21617-S1]MDO9487077.1 DUF4263 domain-containing protein [Sphingomonadaceae bacterium]QNE33615.1 DUF4263 domain-containing protein [Sphingomonas sp. NBWT7]